MKKIQTIILASVWCFVVWATGLMHWELIQDIEGVIAFLVYGLILAFNGFLIYRIQFNIIPFKRVVWATINRTLSPKRESV